MTIGSAYVTYPSLVGILKPLLPPTKKPLCNPCKTERPRRCRPVASVLLRELNHRMNHSGPVDSHVGFVVGWPTGHSSLDWEASSLFACTAAATLAMSYNHNQYNYQIAVIFAILIGGCLLLAGVVGGIYFMCVNTMRDDDKKRLQSGRNSASNWPTQAPSYTASYRGRGPSPTPYNPVPAAAIVGPQSYQFDEVRSPMTPVVAPQNISSYTPIPSAAGGYIPQYSQVPLVAPNGQEYITSSVIQQPQTDVIYTQVGSVMKICIEDPAGFVQQRPVEYVVQQTPAAGFHQSSV
ncbi:unnamed protein product [Caenorhabditis auriculariae]|uniref:Uncharacterized protein n=1 Tax=Caenorhabditis auriculariae TaxID=2777116 RepID=A0A8S1HM90_9PELO|nr:unnamed protein product [Caenorhabditis auriculariae]